MRTSPRIAAIAFSALLLCSMVAMPASAGGLGVDRAGSAANAQHAGASGSLAASAPSTTASSTNAGSLTQEENASEVERTPVDPVPEINGSYPRDNDNDGRYEDVNGDGELGQDDVVTFFENQHRDAWKIPAFDFSGSGSVGHGDVITLFEAVATGNPQGVMDPRGGVDTDGDGLTNEIEQEVTGTDLYVNDSDSSFTDADESDAGVLDSQKDFDGDGLNTSVELRLELDPMESDTDGDGTPDNETDLDGDGLGVAEELARGTNPTVADTDRDGLDDGREVELGTDPLAPDTDDDGLTDAEELEYDLDPTAADTDGDGTADGNETLEKTVEDEESGASVEISGEGGADATVTAESDGSESEVTVGPTVHVTNRTQFDSAEVELPISDGDSTTDDATILKWDSSGTGTWREVPTEVDSGTRTAVTDVDSFSRFTVVDRSEWNERRSETITLEDHHIADKPNYAAGLDAGEELWSFGEPSLSVQSSPTIVDGTVYVGSDSYELYALNASTGEKEWQFEAGKSIDSSPLVVHGTVYVGSDDGNVYALDAETGEREWTFTAPTDEVHSSLDYWNGRVYTTAAEGTLYALDADSGEEAWTFDRPAENLTSSPVVVDGTVYFGSNEYRMYAVDAETGGLEWSFGDLNGWVGGTPTVHDGTVYIGTDYGRIQAIDAETGDREWQSRWGLNASNYYFEIDAAPTASGDVLYATATDGRVFAGDPETGSLEWTYDTGDGQYWVSEAYSSPTIAGGVLYVGSWNQSLYALDAASGEKRWEYQTAHERVVSSPTVADGVVYFGAGDYESRGGSVYAVATGHNRSSDDARVRLETLGHVRDAQRNGKVDPPLRDSSGTGIPDAVADANPVIPELLPYESTDEARIDIDPLVEDTSGDGIPDADAIDVQYRVFEEDDELKLETWVEDAKHHPNRTDTTGDGLTDREQVEGWEIEVVDDHDDATALVEALDTGFEDGEEVSDYFTTKRVHANPLVNVTNHDGLSDVQERWNGTDPERFDTRGDAMSDGTAARSHRVDPTIYTTAPPRVRDLQEVSPGQGWDEWTSFTYEYELYDEAGVASVEFSQEGLEADRSVYGGQDVVSDRVTVQSEAETVLQFYRGADATFVTADVHGNTGTEVIRVQQSMGAIATTYIGHPQKMGEFSGITHGAVELPEMITILVRQPRETAEAFGELTRQYATAEVCSAEVQTTDLAVGPDISPPCERLDISPTSEGEFWMILGEGMARSTHRTQDRDNPYELDADVDGPTEKYTHCIQSYVDAKTSPGTSLGDESEYCAYAAGWYRGYAAYTIAEIVVGSKGTLKAASTTKKLSEVADAMESAGKQSKIATLRSAAGKHEAPTPRVTSHILAEGGPDIDSLPKNLQSSGKTVTARQAWDEVDPSVRSALDKSERSELLAYLGEHPEGHRLLNDVGGDRLGRWFDHEVDLQELFRKFDGLPPHQRNRFANLLRDEDVGQSWLRVVSNDDVPVSEISRAVSDANEVSNFGTIQKFKTGRQVQADEYPSTFDQVHEPRSIVTEFESTETVNVNRLYTEGENKKFGRFTMRSEGEIRTLTPEQLQEVYAIPNQPPDSVAVGEIPQGTTMRVGRVAKNDYGYGGGRQFTIPKSSVDDAADLEPWFSKSDELTEALRD